MIIYKNFSPTLSFGDFSFDFYIYDKDTNEVQVLLVIQLWNKHFMLPFSLVLRSIKKVITNFILIWAFRIMYIILLLFFTGMRKQSSTVNKIVKM